MAITKRSFSALFGLSTFQALAMFRRGVFYTFLGIYLRAFLGLSVTETTLFETLPMILNILFQNFVWGRITDRFQRRKSLIIAGELLAGVGHLLLWYVHSTAPDPRASGYVIIWGLTLIEIFWSMSNIAWSAYISDIYRPEERGAIQGRLASIGGIGRIAGALAGGLLYDRWGTAFEGWGFREGSIFFVVAIVMFVSVIPFLFMPEGGADMGREGGVDRAREDLGQAEAGAGIGKGPGGRPISIAGAGQLRVFAVFLLAMLLINSGVNSLMAIKAQYLDLREGFAASAGDISLAANVESLALILTGLVVGLLVRRFGVKLLMLAGGAAGLAYLLAYAFAPSLMLIYFFSILKGLSDGLLAPASYAFASTLIPPQKRGAYFAAYNATFMLSWGVGATFVTAPLIDALIAAGRGAVLAYRMGSLASAGLAFAGLALLAALLAGMGKRGLTPRGLQAPGSGRTDTRG